MSHDLAVSLAILALTGAGIAFLLGHHFGHRAGMREAFEVVIESTTWTIADLAHHGCYEQARAAKAILDGHERFFAMHVGKGRDGAR